MSTLYLTLLIILLALPTTVTSFQLPNLLLGVVGGDHAGDREWPMVAAITLDDNDGERSFCGGTVWNSKYILTAAHCLYNEKGNQLKLKNLRVYIGTTDIAWPIPSKSRFYVKTVIKHEKYSPQKNAVGGYDIALMKLDRAIDFKKKNADVLCTCGMTGALSGVNAKQCYVVGWGADDQGNLRFDWLREVKVPMRSGAYCKGKAVSGARTKGTICAGWNEGKRDGCQGDSGGPLFCSLTKKKPYKYVQVGIVSWGLGCGRAHSPGYYTDVNYYRGWLKKKTGC